MRVVLLWWYIRIVCSIWHVWECGLSWVKFVSTCKCEKSMCGDMVVSLGLSKKYILIPARSPEPLLCLFLIPSPSIVLYIYYVISHCSLYLSGHLCALLTFCLCTWPHYLYALLIFCLDNSGKSMANHAALLVFPSSLPQVPHTMSIPSLPYICTTCFWWVSYK